MLNVLPSQSGHVHRVMAVRLVRCISAGTELEINADCVSATLDFPPITMHHHRVSRSVWQKVRTGFALLAKIVKTIMRTNSVYISSLPLDHVCYTPSLTHNPSTPLQMQRKVAEDTVAYGDSDHDANALALPVHGDSVLS